MKALTFNPANDQFHVVEKEIPEPGRFDALVKVDACGLNPVDAKIRYWKSVVPYMDDTWVPGLDVSGRIVKLGKDTSSWQVGDRVLTHGNMFRPDGGFAEYTIQDARTLIPHPALTAELAAATPCAGWTAWRALTDRLRISERESILIAGASGGVGGFAVQIARLSGLPTIIATCSARNRDYVTGLGATDVIDYANEDIVQRVLEITNKQGVEIGLDAVGGENATFVADSLAFEGEMAEIVDVVEPRKYNNAFGRGLSFHQFSLGSGHRYGDASRKALTTAGEKFSRLVEQGAITVPILQIITLAESGDALNAILNQRTVGKIVMKIP